MDVELDAYTERTVTLSAAPCEVARYFSANEALLGKLIGPERVTCQGPGLYRVATRGFSALGLSVTPCFDVAFTDRPGVTHMQSKGCHLVSSSDLDLTAGFEGEAQFLGLGDETTLFCWTQAEARLRLPRALGLLPHGVVHGALQALMQHTLDALSARFVPLIREDFAAWQAEERRRLSSTGG
ncbi:MAG TPA: DUF1997 domain-containing protein [Pantanalinema sp.]